MSGRLDRLARCGLVLVLSSLAAPAFADVEGEVETGVLGVSGDSGESKFEEYRDMSPGVSFGADVMASSAETARYLRLWSLDYSATDQHHELEIGEWARYRLRLTYDELEHVYGSEARTLYLGAGSEELVLPAGLQATLEALGGGAQSAALATALSGAGAASLDLRIRTGEGELRLAPAPGVDVRLGYRLRDRDGTQPIGQGYGTPGGSFSVARLSIDDRTSEAGVAVQLGGAGLSLQLGYRGSFFRNDVDSMTVANPLVATDAADAPSRGRMSTAPDNDAHTWTLSGAGRLPTPFPAHLSGSFSYGVHFQDDDFLPHTINSALADPGLALPDNGLDGRVDVLSLRLRATARPRPSLSLRARYRLYDYDNRTSDLRFPAHVISDASLESTPRTAAYSSYRRQDASLDATVRLSPRTSLELRGGWEGWHRSGDRPVESLNEYTGGLGLRLRPSARAQIRAGWDLSVRRGSSYETFAHASNALDPADLAQAMEVGQLVELRDYDLADRIRNRLSARGELLPCDTVSLGWLASFEDADYDDSSYGRTDERRWNVGLDGEWRLSERVALSGYYSYEDIRYELDGRWRPRRFIAPFNVVDDPANDWTTRSFDRVHNGGVTLDVRLLPGRLDGSLFYRVETANAESRSGQVAGFTPAAPPPTTAGDGGNAVTFPDIEDVLQTLGARLRWISSESTRVIAEYRYERFDLTDFQTDPLQPFVSGSNVDNSGSVSPSTDVFLGNTTDDYDAHVIELRFVYRF